MVNNEESNNEKKTNNILEKVREHTNKFSKSIF